MSIVMGLDQHRAQISAEWIETVTGEISRARVAPADRAAVRTFLGRFAGEGLEVALEATTGWRFVVEELERAGAEVHLAEPTETSGMRGKKKRAKTDWADARHLRELLLIGRLPESWIPPAHILDLRARVRCRHLISHQRTEWQQRIQAVVYHHGLPQHRNLMTVEKRQWLAERQLPAAAREQIDVALAMIRHPARPARSSPPHGCPQAARLPSVDQRDLRGWRTDLDHDPRRARRRPAVLIKPRCCALQRSGRHRQPVRSAPLGRASLPARPTGAALGAL